MDTSFRIDGGGRLRRRRWRYHGGLVERDRSGEMGVGGREAGRVWVPAGDPTRVYWRGVDPRVWIRQRVGIGTGAKPFAGITIMGGGGTGASSGTIQIGPAPRPVKTSYGVFIVSTETGGGGLPSFGLFTGQQVYTVYLDMRDDERDTVPSWTIEFAAIRGTTVQATRVRTKTRRRGSFVAFPSRQETTGIPGRVGPTGLGKTVIVYSIINTEGRMEQLEIKDSPDPRLNDFVLDALREWVFRPAILEGSPVPVKALLGIPLGLPPIKEVFYVWICLDRAALLAGSRFTGCSC